MAAGSRRWLSPLERHATVLHGARVNAVSYDRVLSLTCPDNLCEIFGTAWDDTGRHATLPKAIIQFIEHGSSYRALKHASWHKRHCIYQGAYMSVRAATSQ